MFIWIVYGFFWWPHCVRWLYRASSLAVSAAWSAEVSRPIRQGADFIGCEVLLHQYKESVSLMEYRAGFGGKNALLKVKVKMMNSDVQCRTLLSIGAGI